MGAANLTLIAVPYPDAGPIDQNRFRIFGLVLALVMNNS